MACPQQNSIETKRIEKMTKYRQLTFETRERRPSYDVCVLPVVIGALGGGIKTLRKDLKKVFHNNELLDEVVATMQKTVLMDSESINVELCQDLFRERRMNSFPEHSIED